MHAFLILGNNKLSKESKVNEIVNSSQAKLMPFPIQKVDDVRDLKKMVKFSFSQKTAILVEDINSATTEATNAFLKNLEEPTKNIIYILTANSEENVLPTIISRCEVIHLNRKNNDNLNPDKTVKKEIEDFLDLKNDYKFEVINKIKDREDAIEFVEKIINIEYANNNFKYMESYLKTLNNLKLNGNVSLQLTNLVATMNRGDNCS